MAVLIRLCEEDRAQFDVPEWVRFDEAELDDVDGVILAEYESGMRVWFHTLFSFDKPQKTTRWDMCRVWLACRLAGIAVPDLHEFRILIRKAEWKDEPAQADDAVPPDLGASKPSSARPRSKRR